MNRMWRLVPVIGLSLCLNAGAVTPFPWAPASAEESRSADHPTGSAMAEPPKACLDMPPSHHKSMCLEPWVTDLVASTSPREAIARARKLQDDGVIDDCHHLAHHIGHVEFERNGHDVAKAFASGSANCVRGYLHGVMEGYVPWSGLTAAQIPVKGPELCRTLSETTADAMGARPVTVLLSCVHGLGHGLLADGSRSIGAAVDVCQQLPAGFVNDCVGGAFMMYVHPLLHSHDEEQFVQSLVKACGDGAGIANERLSQECARAAGEGLMFYTGHNVDKSLALCQRLPTAQQATCVRAVNFESRVRPSRASSAPQGNEEHHHH